MSNPIFDLQARLKALIAAHTYFDGLDDDSQILTEEVGDIDYQVNFGLLDVGFGVAIKTARGDSGIDSHRDKQLDATEQIAIWIIHNPTADSTHNAVEGLWAVIQAVHGKPLEPPPADPRGQETFQLVSHEPSADAPEGVAVQVAVVSIRTRLL